MSEASYLLDSSILVHLLEGRPAVLLERVQTSNEGSLVVSTIAYAEVMLGAVRADRVEQAERLIRRFPLLPFDEAAAERYARLAFKRGSFDRLIAAHALASGLSVVTANTRDFRDIPNLQIENWTE